MGIYYSKIEVQVKSSKNQDKIETLKLCLDCTVADAILVSLQIDSNFHKNDVIEKIVIPSSIIINDKEVPIKQIGRNFLKIGCPTDNISINYIFIEDGIEKISYEAFYRQMFLHKVRWPSTCPIISLACFKECRQLEEVENIEHVKDIYEYAFSGCELLKKFVWPSGCRKISEYCFSHCSSLEEITNISMVKCIEDGAFAYSGIHSIEWPRKCKIIPKECFFKAKDFKTISSIENVTKIGFRAFAGSSIQSFTWPPHCKRLASDCFCDCYNLTEFTFPHQVSRLEIHTLALHYTNIEKLNLSNVVLLTLGFQIVPDKCQLTLPFYITEIE